MRMDLQERRSKLKLKNSKSTKSRSEMESSSSELREEIVFMDVETTVPFRAGQGFALLEFGAILVCPRKLVELESYSTLIRPADLSSLSSTSVRSNGITREAVAGAPSFAQVADKVYDILHGRVWAGHNILRFDCVRIRDAFMEIGRAPPVPKGTIDSLALLTQKFGRRAGDMKMASLANYFGLGQQKHRSLDDVRMNLEVVKYCATVLFLESCLPEIFTTNSWISPNATTRSRRNGIASPDKISPDPLCHSVHESGNHLSSPNGGGKIHEIVEISKQVPMAGPFDLLPLIDQMKIDPSAPHNAAVERPATDTPQMFTGGDASSEACSRCVGFLNPDEVSIQCISTSLAPAFRGWGSRIHLMHKDFLLQLCCMKMRICFGVSAKFLDYAGRPRLSIVVYPSPSLSLVLDACDQLVQKVFLESGSSSEWRPVVMRKNGSSTIRLHIPTIATGDSATYSTEIYQREASGNSQRLLFSKVDAAELDSLFIPGNCIDAFFSLDVYAYQQYTGIRLVAKRLIVHVG